MKSPFFYFIDINDLKTLKNDLRTTIGVAICSWES